MPEFLAVREDFRGGKLLSRCLPGLGVLVGCVVLAITASRDWEWVVIMLLFAFLSAQGLCMLTIGLVPVSLRRQIVENYALFRPGRKENFISYGFFNLCNLIIISIISKGFFVPAASAVLGGLSLATLVMMLTLRSIRRTERRESRADADHG